MRVFGILNIAIAGATLLISGSLCADDEFDREPILYSQSTPDNRISRLQQRLDQGDLTLTHEGDKSYLRSLLKALDVPVESQMLVFSKTSLQMRRIAPRTPRAVYFNDDVYVGFCQSGEVLEISAVDAQLGTVFYTLNQQENEKPQFQRRNDNCLVCHSSSRTEGVPGHVVRSLYVDASGQPMLSAGSRMVDHTTPIEQRWGGWYVTGTHGKATHRGNLIGKAAFQQAAEKPNHLGNLTSLKFMFIHENRLDISALRGIFETAGKKSPLSQNIVWVTFWGNRNAFIGRHYIAN